jgi:hypothetical protein
MSDVRLFAKSLTSDYEADAERYGVIFTSST